jgi:putative endonuclease
MFMIFTVYILFSDSCGQFYTGHSDNFDDRIVRHNAGETKSTKRCLPWRLVWQNTCQTRGEAMKLENKIKKRGAKRFLEDIGVHVSRGA